MLPMSMVVLCCHIKLITTTMDIVTVNLITGVVTVSG